MPYENRLHTDVQHKETLESSGLASHLLTAVQEIHTAISPEEAMGKTVMSVRAILDALTTSLTLRDEDGLKIKAIAHRQHNWRELKEYADILVPEHSISHMVASENKPVLWKMGPGNTLTEWLICPVYLGVPIFNFKRELVGTIIVDFENESALTSTNSFMVEYLANVFYRTYHNLLEQERLLTKVQIVEQERIAQELHDSVAQNVFSASMKVERLLERPTIDAATSMDLQELRNMLHQIKTDLKTIVYNLPTKEAQPNDLRTIVEHELLAHRNQSNILVEYFIEPPPPPDISEPILGVVRAVVREALTNIRKHSQACAATISLSFRKGLLYLSISDNGKGAEDTPSQSNGGFHFGLGNLRRLVEGLGGSFEIESSQEAYQAGTSLYVRIPITQEEVL